MNQAESLLTPGTRWMLLQGMPMTIVESKRIEQPKAYREATEKFSGRVKISTDGGELFNYVAGAPFPRVDVNDPLAGYKVMWNAAYTDNMGGSWAVNLVNAWGQIDRAFDSRFRRMMWAGRLYIEPKPVIPHNPPLLYTEHYGPLLNPHDMRGTGMMVFRYAEAGQADDSYVFTPEVRRIRRISMSSRSDTLFGTDMDMDSLWGWNSKISYWKMKLLAEKDVLAVMHSGKYGDPTVWCAPRDEQKGLIAAMPCVPWEKRKVWIVEAQPSGYTYGYAFSKRVNYVDKESFMLPFSEQYDDTGALSKVWHNAAFYTTKPYATYPENPISGGKYEYKEEHAFVPNGFHADVQAGRVTTWDAPSPNLEKRLWQHEWFFNEDVTSAAPETFSINYLIQSSH
jgi:hypothetical protein